MSSLSFPSLASVASADERMFDEVFDYQEYSAPDQPGVAAGQSDAFPTLDTMKYSSQQQAGQASRRGAFLYSAQPIAQPGQQLQDSANPTFNTLHFQPQLTTEDYPTQPQTINSFPVLPMQGTPEAWIWDTVIGDVGVFDPVTHIMVTGPSYRYLYEQYPNLREAIWSEINDFTNMQVPASDENVSAAGYQVEEQTSATKAQQIANPEQNEREPSVKTEQSPTTQKESWPAGNSQSPTSVTSWTRSESHADGIQQQAGRHSPATTSHTTRSHTGSIDADTAAGSTTSEADEMKVDPPRAPQYVEDIESVAHAREISAYPALDLTELDIPLDDVATCNSQIHVFAKRVFDSLLLLGIEDPPSNFKLDTAGLQQAFRKQQEEMLAKIKAAMTPSQLQLVRANCVLMVGAVFFIHEHGVPTDIYKAATAKTKKKRTETRSLSFATCSARLQKVVEMVGSSKCVAYDVVTGNNLYRLAYDPEYYAEQKASYLRSNYARQKRCDKLAGKRKRASKYKEEEENDDDDGDGTEDEEDVPITKHVKVAR